MKVLSTQRVMNTCPAWLGSKGVSTGVALHQRVQQCLRLLQVSGVKALGKPAVDRCQQIVGFLALALLLPQFGKAGGRTEFPRLCLLILGYHNSLMEAVLRFSLIVRILL